MEIFTRLHHAYIRRFKIRHIYVVGTGIVKDSGERLFVRAISRYRKPFLPIKKLETELENALNLRHLIIISWTKISKKEYDYIHSTNEEAVSV